MAYYLLHTGQPSAKRMMQQVARLHRYQSTSQMTQADTLIRWGRSRESDPLLGRVLNPRDAINRTLSRGRMVTTLRRYGIRCAGRQQLQNGSLGLTRQYRIAVFDMHPLACFRLDVPPMWINQRIQRVQDNFEEVSLTDDRLTRRVVRLAMRTLHALGLDFGLVSIGVVGRTALYILDVTPHPVLSGRLAELFGQGVEDFVDRTESFLAEVSPRIVLGTDMELMLRNSAGKMVLASKYFTRLGSVGCDGRSVQRDGKRLPLLELRPNPEDSPVKLLNNLRETMLAAAKKINRANVEWRGGSMPFRPYGIGGHIHFSGVPLSSHLIKVLDLYLAVPLMLVENPQTAALRRPTYGFLGDFRPKDWGFEYRTPASFLVSKEVTEAAYCLAYVLAVHHAELPLVDIYEPTIQQSFYNGSAETFHPIVAANLSVLRQLSTYDRFRSYIEPLFRMVESGQSWDENVDVRKVWAIPLAQTTAVNSAGRRRVRATG